MKRELVRFEFLFSLHWYWIVECIIKLMIRAECLSVGHAIGYFWKSFIDNYYTELYSTTGSSEEWFFCVCSYFEHEKQTREISEFFQLTLDQPAGGATKSRTDGNDRRILSEKLL